MHLRKMGIQMAYFIDDLLVMGQTKLKAETQAKTVIKWIQNCDFVINKKKSMTSANTIVDFLGVTLDMLQNLLKIPQAKIRSLKR